MCVELVNRKRMTVFKNIRTFCDRFYIVNRLIIYDTIGCKVGGLEKWVVADNISIIRTSGAIGFVAEVNHIVIGFALFM